MSYYMEDMEKTNFWHKGKKWEPLVVLLISFMVIGFFSLTQTILFGNKLLTWLIIEVSGPLFIFIFLYFYHAEGDALNRLSQIIRNLGLYESKKETIINLFLWAFFSFATIIPIIILGLQVFKTEHVLFINVISDYIKILFFNIFFVALWEEILFRGYLINFLISKKVTVINISGHRISSNFFTPIIAIGLSSILFSVFHIFTITLPFTWWLRELQIILGGLFLGFVFFRYGNLWTTIIIHANFNFIIEFVTKLLNQFTVFISFQINDSIKNIIDYAINNKCDLTKCFPPEILK